MSYGNKELTEFRQYLRTEKRSKGTVKQYCHIVNNVLAHVGREPAQITRDDLARYKAHLAIEKEYSKNSMYTTIKGIQSFFRFIGSDAAEDLVPPRRSERMPRYISEAEAHALIESAKGEKRDYAILKMLGYTGLRVSELCALNVDDADMHEKVVTIKSGKGDKDRIVILDDSSVNALRSYLGSRSEQNGALFVTKRGRISPVSVQRIVKNYAKSAGISKKVTPHVLRHTFATTLLRRGADIRIIQKLLGHSSIATTQIYTHVDESMLKTVYEKSKPQY
ncbi:MAG: integrase [Thermoplasmata archaeon HGW-Thermoplasmata-2]|nr:MAG: integrase [Thermoplasmata archaeon HGW-Thermoplasmata-2]